MKLELVGKNYEIGAKLATIISKKLNKLDRYFQDDAKARVVCKQDNKALKLELTITSKGMIYRAEVIGDNMYENIDIALPKIEKQVVKYASKRRDFFKKDAFDKKEYVFIEEEPDMTQTEIFKKKTFDLEPISIDDAKIALENLDHDFFVFLNNETSKVNILYKRQDKQLGLIECNIIVPSK